MSSVLNALVVVEEQHLTIRAPFTVRTRLIPSQWP